jgi:hypothetical protein
MTYQGVCLNFRNSRVLLSRPKQVRQTLMASSFRKRSAPELRLAPRCPLSGAHASPTHAIPESQRVAVERVAEILDPNGLKIGAASAA